MSPLVEGLSDVTESLLAGSIPYVHGDKMRTDLYFLDFEIYSDGSQIISMKLILTVSHQQTGFTNTAVPYDQEFHIVIVRMLHFRVI